MNPDLGPAQLLNKVMFNIRYYFCHRGTENFQGFIKDMFSLAFDSETGITYIRKVQDEMSKNHHETYQEIVTGFMPQLLNADGCPHKIRRARSFENYLSHLNPNIDSLWQRPLKYIPKKSDAWYAAAVLGHNPIEKFMGNLSKTCELSDHYTNHCIRVTGATNLTR